MGRPSSAQGLPKLIVGTPPSDGVKSLLWAQHADLFKKNGIEVEIVQIGSGSAAMSAVAGGAMQVAFVNLPSLVNAYARGIQFVVVAPGGIYATERPYELLFVKKDSPVRTGRDLNGKTIASPALKDLTALTTLAWVDENGGDSKTVKAVELPASSFLPALDDGRIDAITLAAPFLDQAQRSGKYRVIGKPFDTIAKRFVISAWGASAEAVAKNPDPYVRFGRAMHEAILYSNGHLGDTVDLVAQYTKVDPDVIRNGTRVLDAETISRSDIQPVIDFSLKNGLIAKAFNADEIIFASARTPGR